MSYAKQLRVTYGWHNRGTAWFMLYITAPLAGICLYNLTQPLLALLLALTATQALKKAAEHELRCYGTQARHSRYLGLILFLIAGPAWAHGYEALQNPPLWFALAGCAGISLALTIMLKNIYVGVLLAELEHKCVEEAIRQCRATITAH